MTPEEYCSAIKEAMTTPEEYYSAINEASPFECRAATYRGVLTLSDGAYITRFETVAPWNTDIELPKAAREMIGRPPAPSRSLGRYAVPELPDQTPTRETCKDCRGSGQRYCECECGALHHETECDGCNGRGSWLNLPAACPTLVAVGAPPVDLNLVARALRFGPGEVELRPGTKAKRPCLWLLAEGFRALIMSMIMSTREPADSPWEKMEC